MNISSFFKQNKQAQGGFSLIELMVTITIMVIVTGAVMVNYSSFNSTTLLRSQAFELALDIKESQSFGISTQNTGGDYRAAYGIYVDRDNDTYALFQDDSSGTDLRYDSGEEIGVPFTLDNRFQIGQICVQVASAGSPSCTARQLSVSFKRPDFDTHYAYTSNASPSNLANVGIILEYAEIYIQSAADPSFERIVTVYPSGQVSVN
ncbi:MAG: prepilin-type N-terminal cleavage/methylation domain-containing protein [Patiriisocius sp.]|jgi:prepilin-type N-terminal cleavage/methylation domain-containing protein